MKNIRLNDIEQGACFMYGGVKFLKCDPSIMPLCKIFGSDAEVYISGKVWVERVV